LNHIHDAILDPACRECTDLTRRLETGAEERRQIIARLDAGEFDLPIVKDIVRTFAPERGEIVVDEAVLDLAGPPVDAPVRRPPRRRPRWSRHGKGGGERPGSSGDEFAPGSSGSPAEGA